MSTVKIDVFKIVLLKVGIIQIANCLNANFKISGFQM
jgi:hypothetical protein